MTTIYCFHTNMLVQVTNNITIIKKNNPFGKMIIIKIKIENDVATVLVFIQVIFINKSYFFCLIFSV